MDVFSGVPGTVFGRDLTGMEKPGLFPHLVACEGSES